MGKAFSTIRNYHPRDFDNYVQLHKETEAHDGFGRNISKRRLAEDLGHPSLHPEKNLFVAEQDGCLIGYISAFLEPEIGRVLLDGTVHPLHRRKGIATELFNCVVRHARRADLNVAQIYIPENNAPARKMALHLDMKFVRHFIGFELNLTSTQLPDVTPGDYIIRHLRSGEEHQLTAIQNISFAESWGFAPNTTEEILYRVHLSSCSPEDIIMAYQGDKPVGYCWTRKLVTETSKTKTQVGEIHMIGVDPYLRKKGLGRKVLLKGLSHLKRQGIVKVELTADGQEPAARRLYQSVGFKESMKTEWYEKKL